MRKTQRSFNSTLRRSNKPLRRKKAWLESTENAASADDGASQHSALMARTPIRRFSKKRQRENRKRREFTRPMLEAGTLCAMRAPGCTGRAQAYHEVLKRSAGGAITPGVRAQEQGQKFVPACNRCNEFVQGHFNWARERGFVRSRYDRKSN